MRWTHRACGKTIVLGEHWVVYGAPALAIPVPQLTTQVSVSDGEPGFFSDVAADHQTLAKRIYQTALQRMDLVDRAARWSVSVESTIPVGEGLGSSAALSCALVDVLARAADHTLSRVEYHDHVFALEQLVHGTPSGLDQTVIAQHAPIVFRDRMSFEVLQWPRACWLLAATGSPGSTRQAIATVDAWRQAHGSAFDQLNEAQCRVIQSGIDAFADSNLAPLGDAMNRCHEALHTLGVSTTALEELVSAARGAGALGAKLTGAGLGGAVLALVPEIHRGAVETALTAAGARSVLRVGEVSS